MPETIKYEAAPDYQTFKLQDFERVANPLLVDLDYLLPMFDLQVQNERDKPIVITLTERESHFASRSKPD